MNKWQIICPLVALFIFAAIMGSIAVTRFNKSHDKYRVAASRVGQDLTTKTNSDGITSLGPALRSNLVQFLTSAPAHSVVRNLVPDKRKPIVTISLVNDRERFDIELRWEPDSRKFTPVSYAYPAPWPPTNWPAPRGK